MSPNIHAISLYDRVFHIIEVFPFSLGYNCEIEISGKISLKIGKLKISRTQSSFVRTIARKIQGMFGNVRLRYIRGVAFEIFHVNENEKDIAKENGKFVCVFSVCGFFVFVFFFFFAKIKKVRPIGSGESTTKF